MLPTEPSASAGPQLHRPRRRDPASTDPRSRRTRSAILDAVRRLSTRDAEITVASLCREAGIGRSTFYTQFADIAEVATAVLRDAVASIGVADDDPVELESDRLRHVAAAQRRLVEHYDEFRGLYRLVFSLPLPHRAHDPVLTALADATMRDIDRLPWPAPVRRPDLAARSLAVAATGLLTDWVLGSIEAQPQELVDVLIAGVPRWMFEDPRA